MANLKGKTALVTGASRGLGYAIAREFAKSGADLVVHARKETQQFIEVMGGLSDATGVKIRPLYFDLTDPDEMKKAIKDLLKTGCPDILVNNAGVVQDGSFFVMTPLKNIENNFKINLFAQMSVTQLVLKPMLARESGNIINIASIAGIDMKSGMSAYGVVKAAMIAWTKVLALETGPRNVRANAIAPGIITADGKTAMGEKAREAILSACAMGRFGTPDEVANLACFLASDEAEYINGAVIRLDGGMS